MKKTSIRITILLLLPLFFGCNNTTAEFLAKYAEFETVDINENKAGIFIDSVSEFSGKPMIYIGYHNININRNPENFGLIAERFFIADVRYPDKELSIEYGRANIAKTVTK